MEMDPVRTYAGNKTEFHYNVGVPRGGRSQLKRTDILFLSESHLRLSEESSRNSLSALHQSWRPGSASTKKFSSCNRKLLLDRDNEREAKNELYVIKIRMI